MADIATARRMEDISDHRSLIPLQVTGKLVNRPMTMNLLFFFRPDTKRLLSTTHSWLLSINNETFSLVHPITSGGLSVIQTTTVIHKQFSLPRLSMKRLTIARSGLKQSWASPMLSS